MEPLTIAVIAGAGYLLLKGKGAGKQSIEQLAAVYVGKSLDDTPRPVFQRFLDHWYQVKASGQEGWVMHGITPEENARLGPDWHYLVGRLPDIPRSPAPAPGLVWRRTEVKKKASGLAAVTGAIGSLVGGVVRTQTGGLL